MEGEISAPTEEPKKRKSEWIKKLQSWNKEFLPTFIGVLLAFFLNDLWVEYEENKLIRELQTSIRQEIVENQQQIENQIVYHQNLFDSASYVLNLLSSGESNVPNASFWKGIGGENLKDAAYHTTVSSELLAKMKPELSSSIGNVYSAQRNYESVLQSARTALLSKDWPDYQSWLNYMRWTSSNLLGTEKIIQRNYQEALEKLSQ